MSELLNTFTQYQSEEFVDVSDEFQIIDLIRLFVGCFNENCGCLSWTFLAWYHQAFIAHGSCLMANAFRPHASRASWIVAHGSCLHGPQPSPPPPTGSSRVGLNCNYSRFLVQVHAGLVKAIYSNGTW